MAKNERVSEETFGPPIVQVPVSKGRIALFGNTINNTAIPKRGTSVNQKTDYPANPR
jgi:hypothetical protein